MLNRMNPIAVTQGMKQANDISQSDRNVIIPGNNFLAGEK